MLYGQGGIDRISGGAGRHILSGGTGNDQIFGAEGDDLVIFAWGDGNDVIFGGEGVDRLQITGTAANEALQAVWNGTALTSLTGVTSLVSIKQIHADLLGSQDRLTYSAGSAAANIDLAAGTASGFASIANIANATGTDAGDVIAGNDYANNLQGRGGNDLFIAPVDNAVDTFNGGADTDTVDYTAYAGDLSIDLSLAVATALGTGGDAATSERLQSIESVQSGSGADLLIGNGAANALFGNAGHHRIGGGGGNDALDGGAGDDVIHGGFGLDALVGGLGSDTFVFSTNAGSAVAAPDSILDFEGAGSAGGDMIDISGLAGLAFQFIGSNAFAAGGTNQMRVIDDGTDTFVLIDTDNDTAAEARIRLLGLHSLGAGGFIL